MKLLRALSWSYRLVGLALVYGALAVAATLVTMHAGYGNAWAALAGGSVIVAMVMHLWRLQSRANALYRALAGTVASYRDNDLSTGLHWPHRDELRTLVEAHKSLGDVLREQRTALVQRELLLDTVVQNTPIAIVLVDGSARVVLANLAARKLLGDGRKLEGQAFSTLIDGAAPALRNAIAQGGDALFAVGDGEDDDILHLSRKPFRLNGRHHELFLLRQLTAELRRQEVQTWKKVIRVISHELNNSLAPIASLAHTCTELLRRGMHERLPLALTVIEERARHLETFIRGYARFAKLPAPRREPVQWQALIDALRSQITLQWDGAHAQATVQVDRAQLEQALLNLLRNAHEADGPENEVRLALRRLPNAWRVEVLDRGKGMSDAVIAQALLPFYSTKRNGTGLGLALAREIAEAHGGSLSLANRQGGGLLVSLSLPD